jgi:hypothetical protein
VTLRIFSQNPLDLPRLVSAGTTHFAIDIDVLAAPTSSEARLRASQPGLYSGDFSVRVRPVSEIDRADAERAEQAGSAAGMASLARRCPDVWEVSGPEATEPSFEDPATLALCSVLTTVALGPALPADLSTLLGVRSSQERLKKLLRQLSA